ncbi:hypothetical protein AVEN_30005-1 [Araneus ventricosus]|uniref:Uncharacterized protein n=1 Tax=Araneus ventricosus TaxID=182803 RepID=A0A4Y2NKK6_ARAVE|nr:hypothetical protein AVEN_30005-1 [Araneus ventricosus]
MSPQKKVTRIEVRRLRGPVNAHSCVIRIPQSAQTMMKVLCKQSKYVGGAMWTSAILHKPHGIESGSALNDRDEIIGQHVTVALIRDSSIDKKGSE